MWWPVRGGALWAGRHPGGVEAGLRGSGTWWAGSEPGLARRGRPSGSRRPWALTGRPRPRGEATAPVVSVPSGFKHGRPESRASGRLVSKTSLCLAGRGRVWGYQVTFDHQTLEPCLPAGEWVTVCPAWLGKPLWRRDGAVLMPGGLPFPAATWPRRRRAHAGQDVRWDQALGGAGGVCGSR